MTFTHDMPRRVALLTLLCLLVFAGRATRVSAQGREAEVKELKKAEALLSKLRRLEGVASGRDSFIKAARRLYPGLYAGISSLRDGDLKTDLWTAAALYESAMRAELDGGAAAPDCAREIRGLYAGLCREAAGRAGLLRAKARLHARWAEAGLLYARGGRGAETLEALDTIRAERATDRALAEEAVYVLEGLAARAGDGAQAAEARSRGVLSESPSNNPDGPPGDLAGRLEQLDRLLASLPHDRARRLLCEARDAFRDGLYWRTKAAPARALVVNANSFAEAGALPRLGLRAEEADRAALANLRAALRFVRKAKEELGMMNQERRTMN